MIMANSKSEEHLQSLGRALVFVASEFERLRINWLLGASGALMVWGVKVIPKDLDVLVDPADLATLEKIFSKFISSPIKTYENAERKFQKFKMEIFGIEVEIIGRDIFGENYVCVDFQGRKIPVNPLEKELEFYEKRSGKKDRVELIKKRLKEIHGKN